MILIAIHILICMPPVTQNIANCSQNPAAITRASLPSVLVSAKCDIPVGERELDPMLIEQKARRSINGIGTLQTSGYSLDSQKQAISMMLKLILFGAPGMLGTGTFTW